MNDSEAMGWLVEEGVHRCAWRLLMEAEPESKARETQALYRSWQQLDPNQRAQVFDLADQAPVPTRLETPGRPARPRLVDAVDLPRRRFGSAAGRVALLHSLAHIEFNAINLALDAIHRFPHMPIDYVDDWLRVASDEGLHFQLITTRLAEFNHGYGDLDAHDGLWEMALRTDHDVLVRMALVPRILEARGLDVAPPMAAKLREVGDEASAAILDRIYRDEITHVEVGNRWFRYLCEQRGLDGVDVFRDLLQGPNSSYLKSPYNDHGRLAAGFTPAEMALIREMEAEYLASKAGS